MIASFERYLKRKNYQASMINDLAFSKKGLYSKQKQFKKQGRGNKQKESVSLAEELSEGPVQQRSSCNVKSRSASEISLGKQ